MTTTLHLARRGGGGLRPENTLPAFANAIRWGCHGAQLDVQLTKDQQVVVYAGGRLGRDSCRSARGWITEGEERPISELTYRQLREYDVGTVKPGSPSAARLPLLTAEPGAKIPLLSEVMQLANRESDSFMLVINLESPPTQAAERPWRQLLDATIELLKLHRFTQRSVLTSLDWGCLVQAKRILPELRTWYATMPGSWLLDAEPPIGELPPAAELRAQLKALCTNNTPPWYSTFSPKHYDNDVPRAIRAAGGDGWVVPMGDIDVSRIVKAHEQNLTVVVWSAVRNGPEALHKVLVAGVHGLCTDYPDVHPMGMTANITPILELASRAHSEKNWTEVAENYRFVVERFPRNAPLDAFVRLAIAQRWLKRSSASKATIELGFQAYPNDRSLRIEDAALQMALGAWDTALDIWKGLYKPQRTSLVNHNRYAKTCEALQLWDLHQKVVDEGLARYPADLDLALRKVYNSAVRAFSAGQWQLALSGFEIVKAGRRGAWPSATLYYERQAKLELQLASLPSDEERMACLVMAHRIRTPLPEPQQLAGLPNAVRLVGQSGSGDHSLRDAILKLVDVMRQLDGDIRTLRSQAHCDAVAELARCTSEQSLSLLKLPASYYATLCQHLLRRGYLQPYWLFRNRFTQELQQGRITESDSPHFRDLVSQVTLANEEGDHEYFAVLQGVFERCFREAGPGPRTFLAVSRQYHVPDRVSDRQLWSPEDEEFAEFVTGKTIAIVGPIAGDDNVGDEIDSMDLVVRFNHRGSLQYDPRTFGSRTNLSWYTADDFAKLNTPQAIAVMNGLDYIVVGNPIWRSCKWTESITCRRRRRFEAWTDELNPFLFGAPNGIQRVLLDLLRFDVGRIKVFNSNLFLSMDYMSGYRPPQKEIFNGFVFHDPVANFAYLKRVHELGTIEVDSVLTKMLALSSKSYVDQLSLRYGQVRPEASLSP